MKINEKPVIYGVKTGEVIHYIGKTIRESNDGSITRSLISNRAKNVRLNDLFKNNEDVVIEPIKVVESDEWYDEKLTEVVQKHAEHHPLVNAQWMLDGKRGPEYWRGKTRDPHTIKQLSESKFTRVCQYDDKGVLVKIWAGAKEAAIEVFGDYRVVNHSGKTRLYGAMKSSTLKSSFRLGYYWFKADDMEKYFGLIPTKLNLAVILAKEKERQKLARASTDRKPTTHTRRATVIQYNEDGEEIQYFDNTSHAAYELKISLTVTQRYCRGSRYNNNYILGFGPKKLQAINPVYPKYVVRHKKYVKPPKVVMSSHTSVVVLHYKNDVLLRTYEGVRQAVKQLGFTEYKIRKFCKTGEVFYGRRLAFGEKKTVLTPK